MAKEAVILTYVTACGAVIRKWCSSSTEPDCTNKARLHVAHTLDAEPQGRQVAMTDNIL